MTPCRFKIAFITIGNETVPSTRFRVIQYLPVLRNVGIKTDCFYLGSTAGNRFAQVFGLFKQGIVRWFQLRFLSNYDLVIIQKGLTPWRCRGLVGQLLDLKIPYLLDVDDAIFIKNHIKLPPYLRWLQDEEEPMKLLQHAHKVIVGNNFLGEYVSKLHKDCVLIPTSIDTEKYTALEKKSSPKVTIGWSGTAGTNIYVKILTPALNLLAQKYDLKFIIISNSLKGIDLKSFKGIEVQFIEWKKEAEIEDLRKIDIGVMPLYDDEWSRGKCGFKALLYMALGIPAICSPVGVNTQIIRDGVNGYLAGTTSEWVQKLCLLIENQNVRFAMGKEARKTVETEYSVKIHAEKLVEVIQEACRKGGRSSL